MPTKMKLTSLKKLSTKRWRSSKGSKGPITLSSISLAGSCFEKERSQAQNKSAQLHSSIGGSLTSSLASMYSSELELSSGGSQASGTSRSSSMMTTSSVSSADSAHHSLSPSWSEAYLPYLDEDADDDTDERTLFMGKHNLAVTRPVAI